MIDRSFTISREKANICRTFAAQKGVMSLHADVHSCPFYVVLI